MCDVLQVKHALAYSKLLLSNRFLQKIVDGVDSKVISQNIITLSDTVMHQARLIEKLNNDNVIFNDKADILVARSKEYGEILAEHRGLLAENRDILSALSDDVKSMINNSFLAVFRQKIKNLIRYR